MATQTIYYVASLLNEQFGNTPIINPYENLPLAQAAFADLAQQSLWGNVVNWLQILSVEATVVQATESSPSGLVSPPDDNPGEGA